MAKIHIDTAGLDEIMSSLDGAQARLDAVGSDALKRAAEPVLSAIQRNAMVHRRTGKLQAALKIGRRRKTQNRKSVDIGVFGNDAPHAHLLEFGHGGPAPAPEHPFMAPAYEESKEEAFATLREAIAEALDNE